MSDVRLIQGDCTTWEHDGPPFHALLCDPPYGLGFMGKSWDRSGVTFQPETWARLASHLHPGAFGMAFSSCRTVHRLMTAIEDAGLILHPVIFLWSFGSGFPKATRIDTQIDRAAGAEREQGITRKAATKIMEHRPWNDRESGSEFTETLPATPLAATWQGHRYGLQAIKPACEPCVTFSKTLQSNQFCVIMTEITFLMEVLSCITLSAQDAESIMSRLHQDLRAGVDNSVQRNVGDWESLRRVKIAGESSESSLANLTLQGFVVGPAPTLGAMRLLVRTITTGMAGNTLTWDTNMLKQNMAMMQSIELLWSELSDALWNHGNRFTTETATGLTTDLKTLKFLLLQITSNDTIAQKRLIGDKSFALIVESILRSALIKLQLLINTSAIGSATNSSVNLEIDQVGNIKGGNGITEPIVVFQRPYQGKPYECIMATGAGALNIDGGRIGTETWIRKAGNVSTPYGDDRTWMTSKTPDIDRSSSGRWPANLILDDAAAERLGEQSGEYKGGWKETGGPGQASEGTAARFSIRSITSLSRPSRCFIARRRHEGRGMRDARGWRRGKHSPYRVASALRRGARTQRASGWAAIFIPL